jgi:hypothetical protein
MNRRLSLQDKAVLAMREAVREIIERHKRERRPIAVWNWKAGKVIFMSPAIALHRYNKVVQSESGD